jgi:xanthine dehydrogenase accessory factor
MNSQAPAEELPAVKCVPRAIAGFTPRNALARVAVLGAGDVGAAVAHTLFAQGGSVLLVEGPQPTAPRRGMCWADAVFDGACVVQGLWAARVFFPSEAEAALLHRRYLPLVVEPDLPQWLEVLGIDVVIDARMRKHAAEQADLRAWAACTIGLGPGYEAGYNAHIVIETAWGESLGRVMRTGAASSLNGEPRPILGVGRQRLVYAPAVGVFQTGRAIGEHVDAGEAVGAVRDAQARLHPVLAPLRGVLRGLTRNGVAVQMKTKLLEVDPRDDPSLCFGLGERPQRIAQGVLQALQDEGPADAAVTARRAPLRA